MGYVFDATGHGIRPILGIPGNSRIGEPLELGFAITKAVILPQQGHAIVDRPESAELSVIELAGRTAPVHIAGTASLPTAVRASAEGSAAAIYYGAQNQLVVVTGLPDHPIVHSIMDASFAGHPVTRFAISNDGTFILLAFSDATGDSLYGWTAEKGPRFLSTADRIADIILTGPDAVIADAAAGQIIWIRNVRDQALPALVADSRDGLVEPVALTLVGGNEIYAGDSGTGTILVLDTQGHVLRRVSCGCSLTGLFPLRNNGFRLTERLDQPIFMIDSRSPGERILFIPALPPPKGAVDTGASQASQGPAR